ncbi:auxin transporter-like protein 2-like [Dorcoceras hygrometricum]|uniref:Auxin transporter-like protein 2-like n=1 Tax=Dorcoceras hygrometricum TaxID=472368 RepID=A0A2Z7BMM7_9LAMI|nr:auxin transporter-like protein 2-like [Dorcoceras hygrometricum]
MLSGIVFQIFYGLMGSWTAYLISVLYIEYRSRKEKEGASFKNHVIQFLKWHMYFFSFDLSPILNAGFISKFITFEKFDRTRIPDHCCYHPGRKMCILQMHISFGFQDTLYAKVGKHFFQECDIYGTIDVISYCTVSNVKYFRPSNKLIHFAAQGRRNLSPTAFVFRNSYFHSGSRARATYFRICSFYCPESFAIGISIYYFTELNQI